MIRATVTKQETQQKFKSFPCLGEHTNGLIVLFTNPETGTVVHSGLSDCEVGKTSTGWDMDQFTPCEPGTTVNIVQD